MKYAIFWLQRFSLVLPDSEFFRIEGGNKRVILACAYVNTR